MPEYYLGNPSETDHATETTYVTEWGSAESAGAVDFGDGAFTMGDDSSNDTWHGFFRIEMPDKPYEDGNQKITNVEVAWENSTLGTPTALTLYLINLHSGALDYDNMSWTNYASGAAWQTAGAKGALDIDSSTNYGHGTNGKVWVGTLADDAFTYVPLTGLVDAKKLDWGKTIDLTFHYTANSDFGLDMYNVGSPTHGTANDRPWVRITYENDLPTAPVISITPQANGIDAYVNVVNDVNDADLTKLITCWNNGTSVAVTNNPNDVTDTGIKQFDSTNATHLDANSMATENSAYTFAVFSCDDEVDNPTANAGAVKSNAVTIKRPDVSSALLYTDSACTSVLGAGANNVDIGETLYLKVIGTGGDFAGKCKAVLVNWDSGTSDADENYNRYEFTSVDTTSTNQVTIKHQFSKEGGFAVKVQVEDSRGFRSDKTAQTGNAVDVDATNPVAVLKASRTKVLNATYADQASALLLSGSSSYAIGSNRLIEQYRYDYDASLSVSDGTHPTVVTARATDNDNTVFNTSSSKVKVACVTDAVNCYVTAFKVYGLISVDSSDGNVADTGATFSHYKYATATIAPDDGTTGGKYGATSSEFFKTVEVIVGTTVDTDDDCERYVLATGTDVDSNTDLDEGSNINNSVTNFTVDDGGKFSVGDEIKLDSEVMLVTAVVTNELYVHRAWAASSAATHDDDVDIYIVNQKINRDLRIKDSNAYPSARIDRWGGHAEYTGNDSSGTVFEADDDSIKIVNAVSSSSGGTSVSWFTHGFFIGDTIKIGNTSDNGTNAAEKTFTVLDIKNMAGTNDGLVVDGSLSDETVQAHVLRSDNFLNPVSATIYNSASSDSVTFTLRAYDDNGFEGSSGSDTIVVNMVQPNTLDLDSEHSNGSIAITDYSINRSGGINPQMPIGNRRYPVGNTRFNLGVPTLSMKALALTQAGYVKLYSLIESDTYDYVFFDTAQVDSATAHRQYKLQFVSGSISKTAQVAGQYEVDLSFSILGEEVA